MTYPPNGLDADIEDGAQDIEDEAPGDEQPKKEQPQRGPLYTEAEIKQTASQLVGEVMRGLTANAAQEMRQTKSATIEWAENQVRNGADPKAIKALLELQQAQKQDAQVQYQTVQPAAFQQQYSQKIWDKAEECFDEFSEKIPGGLQDSKQSIMAKFQKEWLSNPDFHEDQVKIQNWQNPSNNGMRRAMALVIDKKLKAEGRQVAQGVLPVSRATAKPATPPAPNPLNGLTQEQRAFYKAFESDYKKAGKEKELLADARQI